MEYERWNQVIGESVFSPERADEPVYLAIDREAIEKIARENPSGEAVADAVEDFQRAVRLEIKRYGWCGRLKKRASDQIPGFVGLLAAQVVAAFDMREHEEYTDKAYWPRLNQLLGNNHGYSRPPGLDGKIHQRLWNHLYDWSNNLQGGRWGRVQLANTDVHRKHVVLPLGQCLLRRGDLDRIRGLFHNYSEPPTDPLSADEFRRFVNDALDDSPCYFSKHAITLLRGRDRDGVDRSDRAFDQIFAEYVRFLQGDENIEVKPRRQLRYPADRSSTRTSVWLSLGKGLSGGLCELQRDRWVPDPKRRSLAKVLDVFYHRRNRVQLDSKHEPPRDDRLLAVWSEKDAVFIETRRARPGDHAILLVSSLDASEWIDQAERLASPGTFRRFRATDESDRAELPVLEGLPTYWAALEFKVREDLSGEQFGPEWDGMLAKGTYLRAEGGLLLRRGRWMAGAGPTLRVVGAERHKIVWIDDQFYPLDESGRVNSDVAPRLDRPGRHRAWLPGAKSEALQFIVRSSTINAPGGAEAGWWRSDLGWPANMCPSRSQATAQFDFLHGPRLVGSWQPRADIAPVDDVGTQSHEMGSSESQVAIRLLLGLRGKVRKPESLDVGAIGRTGTLKSENPLMHALARARCRIG